MEIIAQGAPAKISLAVSQQDKVLLGNRPVNFYWVLTATAINTKDTNRGCAMAKESESKKYTNKVQMCLEDIENRVEIVDVAVLSNNEYKILSIPKSVEGFAVGDVVTGHFSNEYRPCTGKDWSLVYRATKSRSDRLLIRASEAEMGFSLDSAPTPLTLLRGLGCNIFTEHCPMSIDVPSKVSRQTVIEILEENYVPWWQVAPTTRDHIV